MRSLRRSFWLTILGCAANLLPLAAQADEPTIRIVVAGDIMLDCLPGKVIERGEDPFAPFAKVLADADYTVGNLECVVATTGNAVKKPYTFRAHPRCIPLLTKHFDALSIANNHTGDFGDEAFVEQLKLLREAKMPVFGGGHNLAEAHQPLVVDIKGIRVAFLGYNEFKPRSFEAGIDSPGIAWSVDEQVLEDIAKVRKEQKPDLVIPYMHWGWEMETEPNDRQKEFSRKMIDAGADAVIGAHPHCTQGTDVYRDKLIVYSVGNFVFDDFEPGIGRRGWVLRLTLDRKGVRSWETVVADIDDEGTPHPNLEEKSPRGSFSPSAKRAE
jgi:poly-gamma-glutamate capsule biosynthesis protein CapA/YwtB (metallophosphatase superfamily)